jgi:hypothetical protein
VKRESPRAAPGVYGFSGVKRAAGSPLLFFLFLPAAFLPAGCSETLSLMESPLSVELPEPPPSWRACFGDLSWRLEWIDSGGQMRSLDLHGQGNAEIRVFQEWPNPLIARPFVPRLGILPGVLKPAGAIFPHDAGNGRIGLSWQGGIEAFLYWELAAAAGSSQAEMKRRPQYFDWPRFRALFRDGSLSGTVLQDPWIVDWESFARSTVKSGFYKSRITAEKKTELSLPVPAGPWIGTSPFAPPLVFGSEETPVFPAGSRVDTWFSPAGLIRCSTEGWIWIK